MALPSPRAVHQYARGDGLLRVPRRRRAPQGGEDSRTRQGRHSVLARTWCAVLLLRPDTAERRGRQTRVTLSRHQDREDPGRVLGHGGHGRPPENRPGIRFPIGAVHGSGTPEGPAGIIGSRPAPHPRTTSSERSSHPSGRNPCRCARCTSARRACCPSGARCSLCPRPHRA